MDNIAKNEGGHAASELARLQRSLAELEKRESRHKRAERALRASEEKFRGLVNNVPLGVFRATPGLEGRFLEVNPAMERIYGYSREELLQAKIIDLYLNPEDRLTLTCELLSRGQVKKEIPQRRKDGSEVVILTTITGVRGESGELEYFDGINEDITERRRMETELQSQRERLEAQNAELIAINEEVQAAEEELRAGNEDLKAANDELQYEINERKRVEKELKESEEKYRSLFDDSRDAIMIREKDGRITHANQSLLDLFGYQRDEMVGLDNVTLYPDPADREEFQRVVHKKGAVKDYEVKLLHKDGSVMECLLSASVQLNADDNTISYQSIIRDVTEQKRRGEELKQTLAALERSNAELQKFAYVASHDLQEPLRMVSSFTQLLAKRYRDKLDADAHEFIAYAVDGANRMQRLLNDLLAYSRVTSRGKSFAPTDTGAVFEQALANLKLAVKESGVVVTCDALPPVMADELQLIQLLQNLIANAIKFRREAPPRVHVSAGQQGREWVFSVGDNGIGIAPQYCERIFGIFQRLYSRDDYPGTGAGLAICRNIIERHGGRIWVESVPGEGSTFYFTIPLKKKD